MARVTNLDGCETCKRPQGALHKATGKAPSIAMMERWMDRGIAKATDGCSTEPDGDCPHGHVSWVRRLGYI